MSTRSTIAIEYDNGTVEQVYCHSDGYLEYNGEILLNHYSDPYKVRELINNGDLSVLGHEIGEKHPFDNPGRYGTPEWHEFREKYGKMCRFYHRDRGESKTTANYFADYDEYVTTHTRQEYEYILRKDGVWYVSDHGAPYIPLIDAYIEALREDDEESSTARISN